MSEVEQTNKTEAATTLPSPYKITTSSNGEIVSISRSGSKSVSVQKSSLEDIKKVLSKFWPSGKDKMASGATMVLIDAFSGDGAKISLGSLLDIARVIDDLELIGVQVLRHLCKLVQRPSLEVGQSHLLKKKPITLQATRLKEVRYQPRIAFQKLFPRFLR
jgi:hypothetical protein